MRQPLLDDDVTSDASLGDFPRSNRLLDWYRLLGDVVALEQEPRDTRAAPNDGVHRPDSAADDYMATPLEELAARFRALQRRRLDSGGPRASFGEVELDLNARTAFVNGTRADLTGREWSVLEALALRAGRAVAKRDLEAFALGVESDRPSTAIQVYVSRIRTKLGHDLIETVRGIGYRMAG